MKNLGLTGFVLAAGLAFSGACKVNDVRVPWVALQHHEAAAAHVNRSLCNRAVRDVSRLVDDRSVVLLNREQTSAI